MNTQVEHFWTGPWTFTRAMYLCVGCGLHLEHSVRSHVLPDTILGFPTSSVSKFCVVDAGLLTTNCILRISIMGETITG